ncbi:MAG: hypothetical protein H6906_08755 [Hyphomicrobiales bacterium]|nr:hypothetical protein [Hyphomicrobiales bacterium]
MGFHGSYLAARMAPDALARALGLTLGLALGAADAGRPGEDWIARRSDGTWTVFFALEDDFDAGLDHDGRLAALAGEAEVLYCLPDAGTMTSLCSGWTGGRMTWRVWHDGLTGESAHLEVDGTPPPPFEAIRDRLLADQRRADADGATVDHMFDVPVALFEALTGFRHDTGPADGTFAAYYGVES